MPPARSLIFTLVVCLLVTASLASAIGQRVGPCRDDAREGSSEPRADEAVEAPGGPQDSSFSQILKGASPDVLHRLLHAYFPQQYQHGVYESEHKALEAVHEENAPLATSLAQLAKRQNGNTTDPPVDSTTVTRTSTSTTTVPPTGTPDPTDEPPNSPPPNSPPPQSTTPRSSTPTQDPPNTDDSSSSEPTSPSPTQTPTQPPTEPTGPPDTDTDEPPGTSPNPPGSSSTRRTTSSTRRSSTTSSSKTTAKTTPKPTSSTSKTTSTSRTTYTTTLADGGVTVVTSTSVYVLEPTPQMSDLPDEDDPDVQDSAIREKSAVAVVTLFAMAAGLLLAI